MIIIVNKIMAKMRIILYIVMPSSKQIKNTESFFKFKPPVFYLFMNKPFRISSQILQQFPCRFPEMQLLPVKGHLAHECCVYPG